MNSILTDFENELSTSPEKRDIAVRRLMDTRMPFPPFKVIDLQDLKSSQIRAKLDQYRPFHVMHDNRVKKQLYLLSEIFKRVKTSPAKESKKEEGSDSESSLQRQDSLESKKKFTPKVIEKT